MRIFFSLFSLLSESIKHIQDVAVNDNNNNNKKKFHYIDEGYKTKQLLYHNELIELLTKNRRENIILRQITTTSKN